MPATQRLPLSVEDITPVWLTSALRSTAGDAGEVDVETIHVENIVWGTATKVIVSVGYRAGDGYYPERLCIKGGFVPELRAIMATGYQTEALFYRDVAPALDNGLPRCHFAATDADGGQGIVILDDLGEAGATFCDAREPLTVDVTATALELLAGWHSRIDINPSWMVGAPHFRPMVAGLLTPEHWDTYIAQTVSDTVLQVLSDRERVTRAFTAIWASEDSRPPALIHGDANLTNVYLDPAGAPRFLDWQFACRGDVYHDVALFLISSLSIEDRRADERALLQTYLDARTDTAETFDEAWTAYRRHPLHGATYALTPEEMQPATVRVPLAERFAQAAIDLETYRLLGV